MGCLNGATDIWANIWRSWGSDLLSNPGENIPGRKVSTNSKEASMIRS